MHSLCSEIFRNMEGENYLPNERERAGGRVRGNERVGGVVHWPSTPTGKAGISPGSRVAVPSVDTCGRVPGYVPVTRLICRGRWRNTAGVCRKASWGGDVSQRRGRAALGQTFWGPNSGDSHIFYPCFPVCVGPTHISLLPGLGGHPKAALLLYSAGRQGAPFQLHAQAPAHVKGLS